MLWHLISLFDSRCWTCEADNNKLTMIFEYFLVYFFQLNSD